MKIKWVVLCIEWGNFFLSQLIQNRICSEMLFLRQVYCIPQIQRFLDAITEDFNLLWDEDWDCFHNTLTDICDQIIRMITIEGVSEAGIYERLENSSVYIDWKYIGFRYFIFQKRRSRGSMGRGTNASYRRVSISSDPSSSIGNEKITVSIILDKIFQWHTIWKLTSKLSILRTSSKCIRYLWAIIF